MSNKLKRVTRIILIGTAALWLVWDLIAFQIGGLPSSISGIVPRWGCQYPQIILLVGIVLGHLFWPQKPPSSGGGA